jgi:L-alanine-DL-glutamate epimerase-like enolase superfamily enzyme
VIIDEVQLLRLKVPLKKIYKIATAEIKEYDLTLVVVRSGGREGMGEAMSNVPGYFWETPDAVWGFARAHGQACLGRHVAQAQAYFSLLRKDHPCAVTPFLTSLEMLTMDKTLHPPQVPESVPMVAILQAEEKAEMEKELEMFMANGYHTIKIKVGFDVQKDIDKVRIAQEFLDGRAFIRADANQGFNFSQAKAFIEGIHPQGIEFLEQPFKENDWPAMVELSRISPIPLGLDESIYGMEAVEKARDLQCAQFVKFKLMKISSAQSLVDQIKKSQEYGFGVILGNGAAGEISCYHEALVAQKLGTRAGEMNGFLKQQESILLESLPTRDGGILLTPQYSLQLDAAKVERYAVDRLLLH